MFKVIDTDTDGVYFRVQNSRCFSLEFWNVVSNSFYGYLGNQYDVYEKTFKMEYINASLRFYLNGTLYSESSTGTSLSNNLYLQLNLDSIDVENIKYIEFD